LSQISLRANKFCYIKFSTIAPKLDDSKSEYASYPKGSLAHASGYSMRSIIGAIITSIIASASVRRRLSDAPRIAKLENPIKVRNVSWTTRTKKRLKSIIIHSHSTFLPAMFFNLPFDIRAFKFSPRGRIVSGATEC
jgi:hypothetical protein